MFDYIKDKFYNLTHSRISAVIVLVIACSATLFGRVFYLQIIKGEEYQNNYTLSILKEKSVAATRGSIYDRNGNVLAYDKLAYTVTFEDTGEYDTYAEMNTALYKAIKLIKKNGDSIDNPLSMTLDEDGNFEYTVSGSSLQRFLADVFGHSYVKELAYNSKLGTNEANATAQQLFDYLCSSYKISYDTSLASGDAKESDDGTVYSLSDAFELVKVRYAVAANAYQKYIETTIASDVSEKTVADIKEHSDEVVGIDISETTSRVYNNSKYFAHIIGYTGTISEDEYKSLSEQRYDYTLTDKVGKSGIEQVEETTLQGIKGKQVLYVDNVGTVLEVADDTDPIAGSDVYLTLDADLQMSIYNILEKELSTIILDKLVNEINYDKTGLTRSKIMIPIGDVYFQMINNNVLDIDSFSDDDAGETEQEVYATYKAKEDEVIPWVMAELRSTAPTAFSECTEELQSYENYVMELLYNSKIVDRSAIDTESEEYQAWKEGSSSLKEYIEYNMAINNVDSSKLVSTSQTETSDEIYNQLMSYIEEDLQTNSDFHKLIYKQLVYNESITGTQICKMLFEQGVLDSSTDANYEDLMSGDLSAYDFMVAKIRNLEITPAQIALDPCNASSVVVDPNNGQVLACVTYPGYDNNKLANSVDADYYSSLTKDLSYPLLNYATQNKTAPGSTYKPLTATAALTEGIITVNDTVTDEGKFMDVYPNPVCWIYPSSHGTINVSQALRDSCNYFFYTMGYRMSTQNASGDAGEPVYNDEQGVATLAKYAKEYGFGTTTGIEIPESEPEISDEDAVRSAIGQGKNNYTTTQLARYVAAVANSGTVYDLSLIYKVVDNNGTTSQEFTPSIYNQLTEVSQTTWDAIHTGMRMVVTDSLSSTFGSVTTEVAGKTGTAEQTTTRPNHGLFVCYAPYSSPEISIATRIPYGYNSGYAADATANMIKYYFKEDDYEDILTDMSSGSSATSVGD